MQVLSLGKEGFASAFGVADLDSAKANAAS